MRMGGREGGLSLIELINSHEYQHVGFFVNSRGAIVVGNNGIIYIY